MLELEGKLLWSSIISFGWVVNNGNIWIYKCVIVIIIGILYNFLLDKIEWIFYKVILLKVILFFFYFELLWC